MADLKIRSYSNAKQELNKISINEDLTKFAKTVNCIAEYGYDPKKILAEFDDMQYLAHKRRALEMAIEETEERIAKLVEHESLLQQAIDLHSENLSVYNELANIGFGSNELRKLLHTILNITSSNGINHWLAIKKFFDDIETQYDTKLGLESQIESLNLEIHILKEEREEGVQRLEAQPFIGPIIIKLLQLGLREDNILKIAETCLNLVNRIHYPQNLAKVMINTLDIVMTTAMTTSSHIKTAGNDKITAILSKADRIYYN